MKKIKFYGGMLALVAALSATPTMTVHAEDEEILFEATDDNFTLTDIQEGQEENTNGSESGTQEGNANGSESGTQEGNANGSESGTQEGNENGSENGSQDGSENLDDEDGYEEVFDPNRTDIDSDDEEYNTGREEIPDTVLTERERKKLEPINPDEPEEPKKPTSEETPNTPVITIVTQTETPEETPVPKMGISIVSILATCGALGLISGAITEMKYQNDMDNLGIKVVKSKKKYRKRNSKKRK